MTNNSEQSPRATTSRCTAPTSGRTDAVERTADRRGGSELRSGVGPVSQPSWQGLMPETAWPLRSHLELGALPGAVPCARLHTRQILWEWGLDGLTEVAELLVTELATNAVQATAGWAVPVPIRLRLSGDKAQVLIEVLDASPKPPQPKPLEANGALRIDDESGRGLLLVAALSKRWGWYPMRESGGKVVWAEVAG